MKKTLVNIICIITIIFSLISIVTKFADSYCTKIEFSKKPTSICGASGVFMNSAKIYVEDDMKSSIQIFNSDGSFFQRIKIPTKGGDFWVSVKNDKMNIYIVRNNTLYEILSESNYNKTENVYFKNPQEFYQKFGYNEKATLTLGGKIKILNGDTEEYLNLDAPIFPRTIALNLILIAVSTICLIATNNLFKKSLENIHSDTDTLFRCFKKNKL